MQRVIIGSTNPVKIEAVKEAFILMFPSQEFIFVPHEASSKVASQPLTSEETKHGAKNRADDCHASYPDADFCIGLEGGVEVIHEELWTVAWMCVLQGGKYGFGRTGSFLLPSRIHTLIREGNELGTATDIVFCDVNSKQKGGTVSALTQGNIARKDLYMPAIVYALIPFVNPELY